MHLTQKQESLISQYLRDASRRLDASMPDNLRERNLRQLQSRIYRELEELRTSAVSDEDVLDILQRASTAGRPAPPQKKVEPEAKRDVPPRDEASKPIWLGVCVYNAERFGLEPWMLRIGAVLLGLITGPLALICYVAAFGEYYLAQNEEERPKLAYGGLALRAVAPLATLFVLRWGAGKVEDLIAWGYNRLVKPPLPDLEAWGWLQHYEPTYFYLACLSVIPLGILSGLPLANAWGASLKRLAQAVVALYGVLLCFGLASVIVGIILDRVEDYLPQ